MIVTLLGVRGSRPVSRMDMLRYGGNTTSFKIEVQGVPPIYIDGGTGLYEEGVRLLSRGVPSKLCIFITHTHWDHMLSFPFFAPMYEEACEVSFYAPISRNQRFETLIKGQYNPRAFPVPYDQLKARQTFIDARPGDRFTIGRVTAACFQLNHPGTTIGWRMEADDQSVVVVTDNAPIEDNRLGEGMEEAYRADPEGFERKWTEGLIRFMADADLVIYDTHFTDESIKGKRHWGHSTPTMAIEHAKRARAKRLLLHHHAPEDTDEAVEHKAAEAWRLAKDTELDVQPASEGMTIWL
ncbi:MAG: MBL fold metallo-hydrolase [Myxococcales bacterium]|nr:MAG: MBL fold metallo-hydrolase [Myxococcales bacterium]